jgi:hypothetical protein
MFDGFDKGLIAERIGFINMLGRRVLFSKKDWHALISPSNTPLVAPLTEDFIDAIKVNGHWSKNPS